MLWSVHFLKTDISFWVKMSETLARHCCQLSGKIQLITCHSKSATTSIRVQRQIFASFEKNLTLEIRTERGKSKQIFRTAFSVRNL